MISAEGIKPRLDKTLAIRDMKQPVNQHEVRRYLGLTGFFRRFVPHYTEIARPLTELLKDSIPFKWKAEQEQAFEKLKHCKTSSPALQLVNPSSNTELHCDASQKMTIAEKNYHAGKLELMAIIWNITRLRYLLIGIPFTVITDCQAVVHLDTKRTVNPQVTRRSNLLSEYEFEVRHRPGIKMAHADELLRAPVDIPYNTEQELEDYEVMLAMAEEEQVKWKNRYDQKHTKPVKYKVGKVVFLRRPAIHTGEPTKLQPKFRRPLIVNKALPNDVYQVADVTVKEGCQYVTTAHASHRKVYRVGADCDNVSYH
ncbi:hypothetical protein QTP88_029468 [Uroleucon formosanum]